MTPIQVSPDPFLRREVILAAVLTAVFLMLGIIGHDPWKADEPYCVGIVLNMLQRGDWLVPHVGAEPFLEKPPLMFWSGALTAWLFGWALPFVDATRLAAVGWMALTAVSIAWAARSMYSRQGDWLAVMLTLGAFGFWQHSHKLIPDVSQLAGATLTLAAIVRFTAGTTSARWAGLVAGTGIGIAFLSKGLLIPGVYGLLGVLFPLCRRDFRSRSWLVMIGWSAVAALPWLVVWPALLYHASPALFVEWFWNNNIDRFLGIHHRGEEHPSRTMDLLRLIGLAFPASVLAGLALLQRFRRRGDFDEPWPAPIVALVAYAVTLIGTLEISASLREVYFMPVYPALALLGAGLEWTPRLVVWFRFAALGFFGGLGVLLFTAWALMLTGHGEFLPAAVGTRLPLDYVLPFQMVWLLAAVMVMAIWLLALHWRRQLGPITVWFAGATLVWGLGNTLLLPWLDIAKSYRHTFLELAHTIPAETRCVTAIGLGESERAMVQYFTGLTPHEYHPAQRADDCGLVVLMVEGADAIPAMIEAEWKPIWAGWRLGDRNRRFFAYEAPSPVDRRLGTSVPP